MTLMALRHKPCVSGAETGSFLGHDLANLLPLALLVPRLAEFAVLHGNVEQSWRNLLICILQMAHEIAGEVLVLVGHQRVRFTLLSGASRSKNKKEKMLHEAVD